LLDGEASSTVCRCPPGEDLSSFVREVAQPMTVTVKLLQVMG